MTERKSIPAPEIIPIEDEADQVACDGGNGPMGHPVVWYSFDSNDVVECMYCDRCFVKERSRARIEEEWIPQNAG